MRRTLLAVAVAVAAIACGVTVVSAVVDDDPARRVASVTPHPPRPTEASLAAVPAPVVPPVAAIRPVEPPPPTRPRPTGAPAMDGCPPPPPPPITGPPSQAWRPPVLVPEDQLPEPAPPVALTAGLALLSGKGMFVWQVRSTEGGDVDAIVERAAAAGLAQLWVRVGDSRDGFYAAETLDRLVPAAHSRGIAVIGWGFPYLYDPMADAAWSRQALDWRGPGGQGIDGFSPDIERETEGTLVSERRAQVYLSVVRQAMGDRPLVATVYRPSDRLWGSYPYAAMAPYVDAFAPMVYWGCTEPGEAVNQTIERLGAMRPVHVIGQAYNMADEGGRQVAPSGDETWRFLDVAESNGALGASFWVWQHMNAEEWAAMSEFRWLRRLRVKLRG